VTILDLYRFVFDLNPNRGDMERYLEAPLAERMRAKVAAKLAATG
jgi:hypothetical protein